VRELPRRRLLKARLIGAGAAARTPSPGGAAPTQPAAPGGPPDAQDDLFGPGGPDDDFPGFPGFAGADPDSRGQ
jgi:hypothetical protein